MSTNPSTQFIPSIKPELLIVEGVDSAGKTTLIERILERYRGFTNFLEFPKKIVGGGKFKIDTPNEVFIYSQMVRYLDPNVVWIQDRGIPSNLCYGTEYEEANWSALTDIYRHVNLHIMIIDRPYREDDYEDELITLNKQSYNKVIDNYRAFHNKCQCNYYAGASSLVRIMKEPGVFEDADAMEIVDQLIHTGI